MNISGSGRDATRDFTDPSGKASDGIPVTSVGDDTQDRAELHGESRVVGDESRRNGRGRSYEGSGRKKSKYKSGAGRSPSINPGQEEVQIRIRQDRAGRSQTRTARRSQTDRAVF